MESRWDAKLYNKRNNRPVHPDYAGAKAVISNEALFVENSGFARRNIKHRVLKDKLIPYRCATLDCPTNTVINIDGLPVWNGEVITLHLDHINGVPNDNRLSNLRFLCPNCHSQTETWCGRNADNRQLLKDAA